jgi:hypothetical protein
VNAPNEGSAVITTDQIYAELRQMAQTLIELKTKFEAIDSLQKRVDRLEEDRRKSWATPAAWAMTAASTVAAVYGNVKH